jgi:hypothetical protein
VNGPVGPSHLPDHVSGFVDIRNPSVRPKINQCVLKIRSAGVSRIQAADYAEAKNEAENDVAVPNWEHAY